MAPPQGDGKIKAMEWRNGRCKTLRWTKSWWPGAVAACLSTQIWHGCIIRSGTRPGNMAARQFIPVATQGSAVKQMPIFPTDYNTKIKALKTGVTWNIQSKYFYFFTCGLYVLNKKMINGRKSAEQFIPTWRRNMLCGGLSQLVLIGCILTCLSVTSYRMVLIGQIDHVSSRGIMGTTAHGLWFRYCGSQKLFRHLHWVRNLSLDSLLVHQVPWDPLRQPNYFKRNCSSKPYIKRTEIWLEKSDTKPQKMWTLHHCC